MKCLDLCFIINKQMGGNSFEGTQKLTNEQYITLVAKILEILKDLYIRAQPYIPLPEKTVHGDVDLVMILKEGINPKDILELLKIQRFIQSKDNTSLNTLYKNKQVDFRFETNKQQFDMIQFYKSYSGLGGFLGVFLPSKQVKMSQKGLFAQVIMQHIKFQYLITNKPSEILEFYGLDYKTYLLGFQKRQQLFKYLCKCRFINPHQFHLHTYSDQPKLTKFLKEYLKENKIEQAHQTVMLKQPLKQTLDWFNKYKDFEQKFELMLKAQKRKQVLNKKFNSSHIIGEFKISPKEVDKAKNEFKKSFKSQQMYFQYIENSQLADIINKFGQVVSIDKYKIEEDKVEMERKWKMFKTAKKNTKKQEISEQV